MIYFLIKYFNIKMSYFLLKRNVGNLKELTLVNNESITYSGNCYLVSELKNTHNREWIMYYDLYKLVEKNEVSQRWDYNEEYDRIMKDLISNL
jgi:hypothetical protein